MYQLRPLNKEHLHGNTILICGALLLTMVEASLVVSSSRKQILFRMYKVTVHLQNQPPNQSIFMCYHRSQRGKE